MKQNEILNYLYTCSTTLSAFCAQTGAFQAPELNPGQHGARLLFSLGPTPKSVRLSGSCGPRAAAVWLTAPLTPVPNRRLCRVEANRGVKLSYICYTESKIISANSITVVSLKALLGSPFQVQQPKTSRKAKRGEVKQPVSLQNICKRGE